MCGWPIAARHLLEVSVLGLFGGSSLPWMCLTFPASFLGTKMTWSRQQLMHYAASPLSHSPLHLPRIPGVTIEEDEQDDEVRFSLPTSVPLSSFYFLSGNLFSFFSLLCTWISFCLGWERHGHVRPAPDYLFRADVGFSLTESEAFQYFVILYCFIDLNVIW